MRGSYLASGLVALALAIGTSARAADMCPRLRAQQASLEAATRVAAIACNEHMLWYRPFIDTEGRIASATVAEGEARRLDDGATEAWRRVASYWRDSGLLGRMAGFAGAEQCAYAAGDRAPSPACRAFVLDNPWSAAFVSFVLAKADLPGFRVAASHYGYVSDAYLHAETSAFQYLDPATAQPATGDLLCYVRVPGRTYGYAGLVAAMRQGNGPLPMHCDIVVAANPGNDGMAYLVGGNVQQGVTMRLVFVNRTGVLWGLPRRNASNPLCSPDNPTGCSFNRQDWAVLLKLKPAAALARLTRSLPDVRPTALLPEQPACCVHCVVGDTSLTRCPATTPTP
jgi:hypothetical protein